MLKKRKKRKQITCWCGAYDFPHRLTSGQCNGTEWAHAYFYVVQTECNHCHCNSGSFCQVAEGQEGITYCEGYQESFLHNSDIRLPSDIDDYYADYFYYEEEPN